MEDGSGGRVNQRNRTRVAILDSAVNLIREGGRPTVEEAALAAGISKRTAYRYFTSQDHLLADAALDSLRGRMDAILASAAPSDDVYARVRALAVAMCRLAETHEPELRVMVRASLDRARSDGTQEASTPARGVRRLSWIEAALAPVKVALSTERFDQLKYSLAVTLGFDALIVLRDICGLTSAAAESVMVWSATAILDQALAKRP